MEWDASGKFSRSFTEAQRLGDFSVEAREERRSDRKEKKRENGEPNPHEVLYLRRERERFGELPADSKITRTVIAAFHRVHPHLAAAVDHVVVINSGEINALVFREGSSIIIHRGLLTFLNEYTARTGTPLTLDMVASVIGHEAGHLEQNTGEESAPVENQTHTEKPPTPEQKELEYDADRRGAIILEQAGLNPEGSVAALKALISLQNQAHYSKSHPRSYKRMTDLEALLSSPETTASVTRAVTPISGEVLRALETNEDYPHVDDQILRLTRPDEVVEIMRSFDNQADQMEWFSHYKLYEEYRIAREQIETPECQADMLRRVFKDNVREMCDAYLAPEMKLHPWPPDPHYPRAAKQDRLLAALLGTYGDVAAHRREPVPCASSDEKGYEYWKSSLESINREREINKEPIFTAEELFTVGHSPLPDAPDTLRDQHFLINDKASEFRYFFLKIIREIDEKIAKLTTEAKSSYSKTIGAGLETQKDALAHKRGKILALANGLLQNLPSFTGSPAWGEEGSAWENDLPQELAGTLIEQGNTKKIQQACLSIGSYVDRFRERYIRKFAADNVLSNQQFEPETTLIELLQATGDTRVDRERVFDFLKLRHVSGEKDDYTHNQAQTAHGFATVDQAFPQLPELFTAAGRSFPVVENLDDAALCFDPDVSIYQSFSEGGLEFAADPIIDQFQNKQSVRDEIARTLSFSEHLAVAHQVLDGSNWVPESSVGPQMQADFPELFSGASKFTNGRDVQVRTIVFSYLNKIADLAYAATATERHSPETRADFVAAEIKRLSKGNSRGLLWALEKYQSGEDVAALLDGEAGNALSLYEKLFDSCERGTVTIGSMDDFFGNFLSLKKRVDGELSVMDFVGYIKKYPLFNLEHKVVEYMQRGLLAPGVDTIKTLTTELPEYAAHKVWGLLAREMSNPSYLSDAARKEMAEYVYAHAPAEVLSNQILYFSDSLEEIFKKDLEVEGVPSEDYAARVRYFLDRRVPITDFRSTTSYNVLRMCVPEQGGSKIYARLDRGAPPCGKIASILAEYRSAYVSRYGQKIELAYDMAASQLALFGVVQKYWDKLTPVEREEVFFSDMYSGSPKSFRGEGSPWRIVLERGVSPQELLQDFLTMPPSGFRDLLIKDFFTTAHLPKRECEALIKMLCPLPQGQELEDLNVDSLVMTFGKIRTPEAQEKVARYGTDQAHTDYFTHYARRFMTGKLTEYRQDRSAMSRDPELPFIEEMSADKSLSRMFRDGVYPSFDTRNYWQEGHGEAALKYVELEKVFSDEYFKGLGGMDTFLALEKIHQLIPEETAYKDYLLEKLEKRSREQIDLDKPDQWTPAFFKQVSPEELNRRGGTPANFLFMLYRGLLQEAGAGDKRVRFGRNAFEIWKHHKNREVSLSFKQEFAMIQELFPEYSLARDHYLLELLDSTETKEQVDQVKKLLMSLQPLSPEKKVAKLNSAVEKIEAAAALFDRPERQHLFFWLIGHPDFTQPPDSIRLLGVQNECTFDRVPAYFGSLTFEEQKKVSRSILRGENGILEESLSTDAAQIAEAEKTVDETTNKIFDFVFREAEIEPNERAVYRTIFTTLMKELPPERRVQVVFSVMKNFQDGHQPSPEEVMASVVNIGVVFKKAAQIMSERKDVIPEKLGATLSGLKDDATPISNVAVWEIFGRGGLKRNLAKLKKRLGTASMGQVHEVEMTDGRTAVGKIKSPIVDKFREDDIRILGQIFTQLQKVHGITLPDFTEEIRAMLDEESDFQNEKVNRDKLALVFEDINADFSKEPRVGTQFLQIEFNVPEIYECRGSSLLEEKAGGYSLNDLYYLKLYETHRTRPDTIDKKSLARGQGIFERMHRTGTYDRYHRAAENIHEVYLAQVDAVLEQVFTHGVVHADMHRGNVMLEVDEAVQAARVHLIDFGNVIEIAADKRPVLKQLFLGLAGNRLDIVLPSVEAFMGAPVTPAARTEIEEALTTTTTLKDRIERLSLAVRHHFSLGERQLFVNVLKGFTSAFYVFEDLPENMRSVAMGKVMKKLFQ